ncbi:retention module-containing protein [Campylobacter sp. 1BO]|uniref:retention module-containing protein n=1 Tax=Campylobacter sp. 1BO TaxID=3424760 RepID=UPI003D324E06
MATQVGTVRQITGSVIAVDANGNQRILQAGDAIFLGEVIKTAGNSKAVLSMDNGKDVSILDNDTMTIDQSASSNESFGNDTVADITDLQKAILAGEDLTQLEETAAGGNAGAGGEGTAMLNESYFAQGGHESNVYGDGRDLGNNNFGFATPVRFVGTAASIQDEIEVDNRIPGIPDFTFPEDKNKDGTINKDENDDGDGKQDKTTVRVEIPDNVKPGDTIVVETPEGDTIKVPVLEDKDNPGTPPKTVDVPNVPINPDGETLVIVRIDTPNNPGTPNTKPINTDMTPPPTPGIKFPEDTSGDKIINKEENDKGDKDPNTTDVVITVPDGIEPGDKINVKITDPDGKVTEKTYIVDPGGSSVTDPDGNTIPINVDEDGDKGFTIPDVPVDPVNPDNKTTVEVNAEDPAGNKSGTNTNSISSDSTPPQPDVIANKDGSVDVIPETDNDDGVKTTITTPNGDEVVYNKDPNGVWIKDPSTDPEGKFPNESVVGDNGKQTIKIPDSVIPHGTEVTDTTVDGSGNSGNDKDVVNDQTPPKPDVEGNNDGSVNVIPETSKDKDGIKTEIAYTGKDGKTTTVVYDKQPDGTWIKDPLTDPENKLPNTSTKDGDNEVIQIPSGVVKSGTDVIDITTDDAGNKGDDKDQITDTVKPNTPVITNVIDDQAGGIEGEVDNGKKTNDNKPTIKGDAEPHSTVTIYDNGAPIGTTTADKDGKFEFTPTTPLNDGKHDFTATATDDGRNTSDHSNARDVIVDTVAKIDIKAGNVEIDKDGNFTTKITGTTDVENGQVVTIKDPTNGKETTVIVKDGKFEAVIEYGKDKPVPTTIEASVEDVAGNLAVNDVTPPKAGDLPTIEITQMSDDEKGENNATGVIGRDTTGDDTDPQSLEDGLTNDKTPGITGKITPPAGAKVADYEGFTVEIYDGETKVGTTTLKADGTYSIDALKNLKTDGDHALTAKLVAGKESSESAPYNIHVDTTATIGITHIATDVQVGADTGDDISKYKTIKGDTNDHATINNNEIKNFTISGTTTDVEEGQIVTITLTDRDGKQETTTAQVQADGTWRATGVNASTLTGKISVKAEVADKAGNKAQDIDVAAIDAGVKFNDTDIDGKLNVNVSEEGLAGGIKDSSGTSDTTNDAKVTKTITATSDSAVTYTIVTENNTAAKFTAADGSQKVLTSGGKAITWYKEGDSLVGKTSDHTEVLKVSLTANGEATVELKGTIDHPGKNIEDAIATTLRVKATNAVGSTAEVDVKVNIEDDSPQIYSSQTSNLKAEFDGNMNITLVVDFSPSMNDKLQTGDTIFDNKNNVEYKMRADGYFYNSANQKLDVTGDGYADKDITRLDATKYELKQMFDSYTDMGGNVKVNIIAFANTAVSITNDKFVDVKTANEAININFTKTIVDSSSSGVKIVTGLDSSGNAITKTSPVNILAQDYNGLGGTNYEAGMAEAIKSFNAAGNNKFTTDATNKLFFITDGSPTASDGDESVLSNAAKGTKVEGNYHDFYLKATYYNNGTATYSIDSGDQVYKYTDTNGKVHLVSQGFTEIYPRYTYTKATVADLNNDADGNIETRYGVYTRTNADELYNSTYTYKDANKTDIHNLSTGELKQWRDFIEKNHIEAKTYYIGNEPITYTDNSITADDKQQPIYKIGWDGTEGVGKGKPIQPQDFKDFGKLEGKTIEGKNLIRSDEDTSDAKFNFGADEIGKVEIVIDGNKFKYDAATNKISVVRVVDNNEVEDITEKYTANIKLDGKLEDISVGSQGSKLSIDMKTGDYSYTPGAKIAAPNGEEKIPVKFTIIDKDGDSSTATTTLSAHSTQPSLDIRLLSFVDDVKSVVTSNNVTIVERYSASDSIAHENIDITGGTKNSNVRNYDVGLTNDAQPELKFAVNIPEGGATVKVTIGGKTFNYNFAEKGNSVLTVKVGDLAGDVSLSEANANFSATITAKSSAVAAKLSPVTLNAKVDLDITPDTLDAKVDVNANGDVTLASASVSDTQTGNSKNTADKLTVTLNDGSVRDVPLINGNVAATLLENGVTADSVYTLTHTDKAGNKTILDKSITVLTPTPISLELSENDMSKADEHTITAQDGYTYTLKIANENTGLKYIDEQGVKHDVKWKNISGKIVGVADGVNVNVIEVAKDANNKVSAKLLKPVEHDASAGSDTSKLVDGLVLTTSKTGTTQSVNAKVMLTIADDAPAVGGEVQTTKNIEISTTTINPEVNVTLVLDCSGSMYNDKNKIGTTLRVDYARKEVLELLDSYESSNPNTKVGIVMFGTAAVDAGLAKSGKTWLTIEEARDFVKTHYTATAIKSKEMQIGTTNTNYDIALGETMNMINKTSPTAANRVYFIADSNSNSKVPEYPLGDGTPGKITNSFTYNGKEYSRSYSDNCFYVKGEDASSATIRLKFSQTDDQLYAYRKNGSVWTAIINMDSILGHGDDGKKDLGIDADEANQWKKFIEGKDVKLNVYTLGGVDNQGLTQIDSDGVIKGLEANKLEVQPITTTSVKPVTGNFVDKTATGGVSIAYGADGGKSVSVKVSVNGSEFEATYNVGGSDSVKTFTLPSGSVIEINLANGSYTYKGTESIAKSSDGEVVKIDYTVTDKDGDEAKGSTEIKFVNSQYETTKTAETITGAERDETINGEDKAEYIDGKGGADTIKAGGGDDTIVFDEKDVKIDGGEGKDTLVIKESIDFSQIQNLNSKIDSIERIDLGKGGTSDAVTLTIKAQDVLDITDNKNTILKIDGDSKDTIKGNWTKASGTEQSKADAGYSVYEGVTDQGQTIYIQIDQDIKTDFN